MRGFFENYKNTKYTKKMKNYFTYFLFVLRFIYGNKQNIYRNKNT